MRAGGAYCGSLLFEELCVRRTAGIRLADDMALLLTLRFIITQVRELLQQSSVILRWVASRGRRRCLLALRLAETTLSTALDSDGGRHDRHRSLPTDQSELVV